MAALDPFQGTSQEPNMAGRHALVVTPSETDDLPVVTKQLLLDVPASAVSSGAAVITLVFADDNPDLSPGLGGPFDLTISTAGFYCLSAQVRRVVSAPAGVTVMAIWG